MSPLPARLKTTLLQATGESWKGLYARLLSARKFARVNALALRKISKKHDKVLGSRAGHQFLQVRHGGSCCLATPPSRVCHLGKLPVCVQTLLLAALVRPASFRYQTSHQGLPRGALKVMTVLLTMLPLWWWWVEVASTAAGLLAGALSGASLPGRPSAR